MTECPVCLGQADSADPACPECGWQLTGGYLVGEVTPERRQRFEAVLAATRLSYALRTAALAAGYPDDGDPAALDRFIATICAGSKNRPSRHEVADGVGHLGRPSRSPRALTDFLVDELSLLRCEVTGTGTGTGPDTGDGPRLLLLVEVRSEGLAFAAFTADRHGSVLPMSDVVTTPWEVIVPALSRDPVATALRLAGAGASSAEARRSLERDLDALGNPATPVIAVLDEPDAEIVLLLRRPLWWAGNRLVDALRARVRRGARGSRLTVVEDVPVSFPPLSARSVDELLRMLPLGGGYGLVVAALGSANTVSLQVHPLFPVGQRAAAARPVELRVRATMTGGQPVLLTLVPTHGSRAAVDDPLSVHSVALRPAVDYLLRATLRRPGTVDFDLRALDESSSLPVADTVGASRFDSARMVLPERLREATFPLDLVVAIEAGGEPDTVHRRFALAERVVSVIEHDHPSPEAVRYSVLPYLDHNGARSSWKHVVLGQQPASAAQALGVLGQVPLESPENVHTAPVEDALFAALKIRWRPAPCRRVLVLVGSRMPNQAGHDQHVPRCPGNLRWERLLKQLGDHGVQVHAVWDPPRWTSPGSDDRHAQAAVGIWRRLGEERENRLHRVDPRRFAHVIAAIAPESDRAVLFPIVVRAAS